MKKTPKYSPYRPKPISPFKTLDEEAEFWDTHDTADFGKVPLLSLPLLESEKEDSLTVRLQKTVKLKLARIARAKGISVGTLSRMWLIEKLAEVR